jgi:hypothetical protein
MGEFRLNKNEIMVPSFPIGRLNKVEDEIKHIVPPSLQAVTDIGATTTNNITAQSFITTGASASYGLYDTSLGLYTSGGLFAGSMSQALNADGSGYLANSAITWDTLGRLTLGTKSLSSSSNLLSIEGGNQEIISEGVLGTEFINNGSFATASSILAVTFTVATQLCSFNALLIGACPKNGQRIHFSATSSLPAGISATTLYYVVNSTADLTFQVSLTNGGAPVVFTTAGSGVRWAIDWTPTNDCTYDLTNGKATFAYSAGGVSTLGQHVQSSILPGGSTGGFYTGAWYKCTYTVSGITGTPSAVITAFSATDTALDLTAGTHTTYFKAVVTTSTTPVFTIKSTLTSGQAFSLDDISLLCIEGGDLNVMGNLSLGVPAGETQAVSTKLVVRAPESNRSIDVSRILTKPVGDNPTSIYAFDQVRYTYTSGLKGENVFQLQCFLSDQRNSLYLGTSLDSTVALSGQILHGGFYRGRNLYAVGMYNQVNESGTYSHPNNDVLLAGFGSRIKMTISPTVQLLTGKKLDHDMCGTRVEIDSTSNPTLTSGTYNLNVYGLDVIGASVSNTSSSKYITVSNKVQSTGWTEAWFLKNDSDLNSYLGTGRVGIGSSSINANAILDVQSTTKAFMPPRMTTTQKNAIPTPTSGMVVYDSTLNKLCVYGVASWETITSI